MPAGSRQQSNAMLYATVTFVALFIIATVLAVVFYFQFEKQRIAAENAKSELDKMATSMEIRKVGTIVGTVKGRKSTLGTMIDHLDQIVYMVIGGVPEETSAEVKVETANRKFQETLQLLAEAGLEIEIDDPNTTGLVRVIKKLKTKLDSAANTAAETQKQLADLQGKFDDAMATSFEKEQTLLAEKDKYEQRVDDIANKYGELETLTEQNRQQQVNLLTAQRDDERDNMKRLNQKLLKTQAELNMAENRMSRAQQKLQKLVPLPDSEAAAFKSDGKIILIDDQAGIVHLNIGSEDRVYRGLTFAVHEKNLPIPKTGKGKAEIEVFNVGKTFSAARITQSSTKRPIVIDDIIANLIWDSTETNIFVLAGGFDLDDDGAIDFDAESKLSGLIEKWGAAVAADVTVNTDFLILGQKPKLGARPTFEQMAVDPMAVEKYESAQANLDAYNQTLERVQILGIPVFNTERFLYFIGYKGQADRAGAF